MVGRAPAHDRRDAPPRRNYVKDHLGSVRTVVDASGAVKEARDYYPFGLRMPGRHTVEGAEAREDFTGHERDAATGLHYAGARYYLSAFGRWNATDPLADDFPAHSPYNYVLNDPLGSIDPTGMASLDVQGLMNDCESERCSYEGSEIDRYIIGDDNRSGSDKPPLEACVGVTCGYKSAGEPSFTGPEYAQSLTTLALNLYGTGDLVADQQGKGVYRSKYLTKYGWRSAAKADGILSVGLYGIEMAVHIEVGNTRGMFEATTGYALGGMLATGLGAIASPLDVLCACPLPTIGGAVAGAWAGEKLGRPLGGAVYQYIYRPTVRWYRRNATLPPGVLLRGNRSTLPPRGSPGRMY